MVPPHTPFPSHLACRDEDRRHDGQLPSDISLAREAATPDPLPFPSLRIGHRPAGRDTAPVLFTRTMRPWPPAVRDLPL